MALRFPYGNSTTKNLGTIPTVKFWLPVLVDSGQIPFLFLFDTGADITSLPISAAKKLRINLDSCPKETMTGYEGTTITVYRSKINILFDKNVIAIPCVFTSIEDVPILLGKAGILERFMIRLDGKKKEIVFQEI